MADLSGVVYQDLPVAGYQPQSGENVAIVNQNKMVEEYLLRMVDALSGNTGSLVIDQRWLSIARTSFEQGFMAMNRAVFQPQRVQGYISLQPWPGSVPPAA